MGRSLEEAPAVAPYQSPSVVRRSVVAVLDSEGLNTGDLQETPADRFDRHAAVVDRNHDILKKLIERLSS
ncbi:hypothetical protein IPJ72_01395 [Candidatus Peregrinibacteria bacterium]|nr:MAG: hypothetical protein IPJ72_01395 [Candidatus Peregrinibacteria bacterium]